MLNTIIVSQNFPPIEGGIQTYMFELAQHWDKGDVQVLCELVRNESEYQEKPYRIIRIKNNSKSYFQDLLSLCRLLFEGKKFSLLKMQILFLLALNRTILIRTIKLVQQLLSMIEKQNSYVIQCSKPLHIGVVGLIGKALFNIDYVIYIHGTELNTYNRKKAINKLYRCVMKYASIVFSNSNYTKQLSINIGATPSNIIVQNLGANIDQYYPEDTKQTICQQLNIPVNSIVLLSVSHLVERKGHLNVIRVLKKLIDNGFEVHYIIIGQGYNAESIKQLTDELSLNDYVRMLGYVATEEINSYMNACDMFVMPNYQEGIDFEGFGIVFLEANACKKPVIGGNSGGVTDAVLDGVTGFLVEPNNDKDLYNKIEKLLLNPDLLREFGENGYQRVLKTQNWENVCQQINAKICELI